VQIQSRPARACGAPELGHGRWSAVSGCTFVLVDQVSKERTAPDVPVAEVRVGMIGAWREEPQRSMWPPLVVVSAVLGKDGPQVPLSNGFGIRDARRANLL